MSDADDAYLDEALYLASNPDVAHAYEAGLIPRGGTHWRDIGRDETRGGARPTLVDVVAETSISPTRTIDPTFDAALYLEMNADLRTAFGDDLDAARRHWAEHGNLEGRYGAGDAPHRARTPDLAAILARPFGVDLYLSVEEREPDSVAGRRLLRGLRRASIPVGLRPFVERDKIASVPASDAARPPAFRVSLIAASPQTLRRLLRAYPDGHFDASYVIGFWPNVAFAPHMPDYPTFGAVDEVWVSTASLRDRLSSIAPVPVRLVRLPAASLPARDAARAQLGLSLKPVCIMLDADLFGDGEGGCPPEHLFAITAAWRAARRTERSELLVVRANARSIAAAEAAIHDLRNSIVVTDQRTDGYGSLVLAACDAMIASAGLDADIADARAAGLPVIAPTGVALEIFLRTGAGLDEPPTKPSRSIRDLLVSLGLDMPAPRFAAGLGRSRSASLPVPRRSGAEGPIAATPVVSILLDARTCTRTDIDEVAAVLAAGPHPFWELCLAVLDRPVTERHHLPADPRVRLAPVRRLATPAAALDAAAATATGSHVVITRSNKEALAASRALAVVAARLRPDLDVLIASDRTGCPIGADRIQAGGASMRPVAFRLSALHASGGFRDRAGPAAEYDLLLRIETTGGSIDVCPLADAPARDPDPPEAEEANRLVLDGHLRAAAGPLAYAEPGLLPGTYRCRTHATRWLVPTIVVPADSVLDVSELPGAAKLIRTEGPFPIATTEIATEHVVFLERRIARIGQGALTALLEFSQEQAIGAVGARILHADGTLHHAGLVLSSDGSLRALGHGHPDDPAGYAPAFVVGNPDAVGGVLAIRRSVLIQAGGFDQALLQSSGVSFDLLAAELCLRIARDLGLRTAYTPFAVFRRSAEPPGLWDVAPPTDAERLLRSRWSTNISDRAT